MDELVVYEYEIPISETNLDAIVAQLRQADVFTPTFAVEDEDIYDLLLYRHQQAEYNTRTRLFVDRNVFTRWISLVKGLPSDPMQSRAAAVMAFAQCANMVIEPNISLYEYADSHGNDAANAELQLFRKADNIHPQRWADVAVGRTPTLTWRPDDLSAIPPQDPVDFMFPLHVWRRNYIFTLKLAELLLNDTDTDAVMQEYLRWMYDDFLLRGAGLVLGLSYLSGTNRERKRLLKNLYDGDREAAIKGIRNAAWDLTVLSEWQDSNSAQESQNTLTLLCSFDKKLTEFARAFMLPDGFPESVYAGRERLLCGYLGAQRGQYFAQIIDGYFNNLGNPDRYMNRSSDPDVFDRLIANGEITIRSWQPTSK